MLWVTRRSRSITLTTSYEVQATGLAFPRRGQAQAKHADNSPKSLARLRENGQNEKEELKGKKKFLLFSISVWGALCHLLRQRLCSGRYLLNTLDKYNTWRKRRVFFSPCWTVCQSSVGRGSFLGKRVNIRSSVVAARGSQLLALASGISDGDG